MHPVVLALPWLLAPPIVLWRLSRSTRLNTERNTAPTPVPRVSVICPARNEAHNIGAFVRAALASTYPDFELIVVDDHSTDGTGDLARAAGAGDARLTVLTPPPLADGWFGKQWACHAGAQVATGEIILFTDADTRHGPELLVRGVNAMHTRGSDLLSVAGRQELVTFWERVVQPAVFASLIVTFGGTESVSRSTVPKRKIANGQCFFVRAETYRALDGHVPVRAYVAEDLMIAQQWCAAGKQVHVVVGLDYMSTRMYTSLREIIAGWTKNIYAGGRRIMPDHPVVQFLVRWTMPLPPMTGWIPAAALILGLTGVLGPTATAFGAIAYLSSSFWWLLMAWMLPIPLWYAFLHPLGGLVATYIYLMAAIRGDHVEWKGRTYHTA